MTSKKKHVIAWIIGFVCGGILVVVDSIVSRGEQRVEWQPLIDFKEGGQLGLLGTLVGYALARLVLAFVASTGVAEAVRREDIERVKALLDKGEEINARDLWGNTALCHAANLGNVAIVKLLIEKGANPKIKNLRGRMPRDLTSNHQIIGVLDANRPS